MKKIYVLGMGDSIRTFGTKLRKEITIGVNYIYKYYPADIVLSMDKPTRLPEWKLRIIANSLQRKFISPFREWEPLVQNFCHKPLSGAGRGNLKDLDDLGVLCYSGNGAFCAIVEAFHMGAKQIVTFGVDFTNHPAINGKMAETEIKRIIQLRDALKIRGVDLFVGSKLSRLYPAIPLREHF